MERAAAWNVPVFYDISRGRQKGNAAQEAISDPQSTNTNADSRRDQTVGSVRALKLMVRRVVKSARTVDLVSSSSRPPVQPML